MKLFKPWFKTFTQSTTNKLTLAYYSETYLPFIQGGNLPPLRTF